jgi:VIT1/CCC1 family predicted Fe2+/Mn2+ transporter
MGASAPFQWSPSDLREVEANYRDEVSSRWMYLRLADVDRQPKRSEMFRDLAIYEERHAGLWAGLLKSMGRALPSAPPMWEHRVLVQMARVLGVGAVMSLLHRQEVDGVAKYRDQARRWQTPEADRLFRTLLPDEVAHEIETFNTARADDSTRGSSLRSILLGAIDGFASIVALSAGVAGITNSTHTVLIAGSASLVAGAISMAASEYVSVKAESEAESAQAGMEREAMEAAPDTKRRQLVDAYVDKGLTEEEAGRVVDRIAQRPDKFLASLLAERLGISPKGEEHPGRQGLLTGISFALAGALPLIPFLVFGVHVAVLLSVLLTGLALFFAGLFRALSSLQPFLRSGLEMVLIGMGSAAATFLIGLAIGGVTGG